MTNHTNDPTVEAANRLTHKYPAIVGLLCDTPEEAVGLIASLAAIIRSVYEEPEATESGGCDEDNHFLDYIGDDMPDFPYQPESTENVDMPDKPMPWDGPFRVDYWKGSDLYPWKIVARDRHIIVGTWTQSAAIYLCEILNEKWGARKK